MLEKAWFWGTTHAPRLKGRDYGSHFVTPSYAHIVSHKQVL